MKKHIPILFVTFVGVVATSQHANADAGVKPIAIGLAPSSYSLETGSWGLAPELIGYGYIHVEGPVFARVGARLGSRGYIERDMPTDLNIREREVSLAGDVGLVRQGAVVPSLSLQVGLARRWFDVTATDIDVSMSRFGRSEWLPMVSLQAGLGLPLTKRVLVEPFVRFETLVSDTRLGLRWGVEATVALY
jgi:hypothetical protein